MKINFQQKTRRLKLAAAQFLVAATILWSAQPAFSYNAVGLFPRTEIKTEAAETFFRTELYFGRNKPGGTEVSEGDWNKFLETEITPRFPEGYTVLEGAGHFRDSTGRIIAEKSKVLVLLYPARFRKTNNRKIEQIRQAYKQAFQQESVLRLDFGQSVRASF